LLTVSAVIRTFWNLPGDALPPNAAEASPGESASEFFRFENVSKDAEIGPPARLAAPKAPPLDWLFALPFVLLLCVPWPSESSRDSAVIVPGAIGLVRVSVPAPDRFETKILLRILAICAALPYYNR
jgi:hypothetical protein